MKTIIVVPTYNESENIEHLIKDILNLNLDLEVLVVDDNSPDGTADIVEKMSKVNSLVHVLVRKSLKGRGAAGKEGFKYALDNGADYIIEMDADFSHDPKYIPDFLDAVKNYDVVIGSRFVKGGKDLNRGLFRKIVTKFASIYVRCVLGINIKDCSSGYRCFRREVLETINIDNTISLGPAVLHELLYKSILKGFRIKEISIVFVDRKKGKSTFDFRVMLEGFLMILILRFLFSRLRHE